MPNELFDYVLRHTVRGDCQCGHCCDVIGVADPKGHTIDMVFFKVAPVNGPTLEEFTLLTAKHDGHWGDVDPFDGKEHSYLELGGWIGDQGIAMQYMALGASLGAFDLLTPRKMGFDVIMSLQMAGMGLLTVKAKGGKAADGDQLGEIHA
jgi:hypothetical protein